MGKYTKKTVYTSRMNENQILDNIKEYFSNVLSHITGRPFSQAIGTEIDFDPETSTMTVKPIDASDVTVEPEAITGEDGQEIDLSELFTREDKDSHTIEWSIDLNVLYRKSIHRVNNIYLEFDLLYNDISTCEGANVSNLDDGIDHLPESTDITPTPDPGEDPDDPGDEPGDDPEEPTDDEKIIDDIFLLNIPYELSEEDRILIDNIFINGTEYTSPDGDVDNIFS